MPEIKRYYLPKLFGGPRNAQRVSHDPAQTALIVAKLKKLPFVTVYDLDPYSPTNIENVMYTRREFGGPQGTVVFFAESKLSNEEAADRLWRYLMRASGSREWKCTTV
jgi:isochorismate hydrolase